MAVVSGMHLDEKGTALKMWKCPFTTSGLSVSSKSHDGYKDWLQNNG